METGASVVAQALKKQGVEYAFGVVGVPIIELATAMQDEGLYYIGMRNEQAASYAASAVGYLTGRPGVCLVVTGPGLIHALAGMANALVNCWPMVVVAGGYDQNQVGMGGFQEWPQVESSRLCTKYAARIEVLESAPFLIEKAVRMSIYGRPGPCYIEVPGNMITHSIKSEAVRHVPCCPDCPMMFADPVGINKAVEALKNAKRPLVIIGKGAAYGRAEAEIQRFLISHYLPFLPTPMGKGVMPDDHPLCVAAARSRALKEADVILLLGARLNWILHFGKPPRFNPTVKIIQVDICPEEMNNNVPAHVMLTGHIKAVMQQLSDAVPLEVSMCIQSSQWWDSLKNKMQSNRQATEDLFADRSLPMSFYAAYNVINSMIPRNAIIVNEGANTMDIGRSVVPNHYPRHRLDAGTFGTMGVGCGFAIAAALINQRKPRQLRSPVVCIQGDSAFGFSGMEIETACRYNLPIVFIILNNNGIFTGLDKETYSSVTETSELPLCIPPTCLLPGVRYDKISGAFHTDGYNASTPEELAASLHKCLHPTRILPTIINVEISPTATRKAQEFSWLTKSKL